MDPRCIRLSTVIQRTRVATLVRPSKRSNIAIFFCVYVSLNVTNRRRALYLFFTLQKMFNTRARRYLRYSSLCITPESSLRVPL
jgi:hypothetical protein